MSSKIIRNYLPELLAQGFLRSKPSMVTVNLTNKCNQYCIYCEIGNGIELSGGKLLTTDDLHWIIDQMAINKIRKISLCGGEPFLFKDLIEIVAYAGTRRVWCSITTNGMTAHQLSESDLTTLKECKSEINISIDSFQESIQSHTRGTPAALPNALKSIQKLSEKEIPVTLLTAVSKFNYHNLYNFFTVAYEMGVQQVLFQPIIYHSNYPERPAIDNKSQLNVSIDELDKLMSELKKILRFERSHLISTNVYRLLPWIHYYLMNIASQNGNWFFHDVLKKFYCRDLYAIIDISYYGGIQPCGLANANITIHENRHLGLLKLWSEATSGIRNDLRNDRYHVYCNSCCHHFSRNMLASIMKYPLQNRDLLIKMAYLLGLRIYSKIWKRLFKRN